MLDHPFCKESFLDIQPDHHLSQPYAIPLGPVTERGAQHCPSAHPCEEAVGHNKVASHYPLVLAEQTEGFNLLFRSFPLDPSLSL